MRPYAKRDSHIGMRSQTGAPREAHGGWAARASWKRGQLEPRLEGKPTAGWGTKLGRPLGGLQRILPGEET